jgi:F-type H+-transporting ATPase subunit epsilon
MLKLTVVTPEKKLITDVEIEDVVLPGYQGELNVLEGHAALMTTLSAGVVQFRRKGSQAPERIVVSWGYCEVANNVINILAETAERPEEIDVSRAEKSLQKSEQAMGAEADPQLIEKNRLRRERALVRIAVSRMNH